MLGQDRVDERVIGVEEVEHRADPGCTRSTKKRMGSSYIAWRSSLVKLGEPLAVDAVVLLEAAELQPVAGELRGQAADAVVAEHAPRLRDEHLRLVQVARGGVGQQLVVGHARPEEVAQPAGQGVVRQRLRPPRPAAAGSTR